MIDIHSHILPCVDDGSESLAVSIEMLKKAVSDGVTGVVFTPHLRLGFNLSPSELQEQFDAFCAVVNKEGINVDLYLGQEIYIEHSWKKLFNSNGFVTMAGTKYVLIEFSYTERQDYSEIVYELVTMGYKPIVAHVERYSSITLEDVMEMRAEGGLIQINAESLVGMDKRSRSHLKYVKKLFKYGLVDFVASDVHSDRLFLLKEAFNYVKKKFGEEAAQIAFRLNAEEMVAESKQKGLSDK